MAKKTDASLQFTREELVRVFTVLGADEPEAWTDSQLEESIPQLHRFIFLRKAWSAIPDERSHDWITADIRAYEASPAGPYSGAGRALSTLRRLGVQDAVVTELVRAKLAEFLFNVTYLMADPGYVPDERYARPELSAVLERVSWALFATDDEGRPLRTVDGLHESVLETDPLHREAGPSPGEVV